MLEIQHIYKFVNCTLQCIHCFYNCRIFCLPRYYFLAIREIRL